MNFVILFLQKQGYCLDNDDTFSIYILSVFATDKGVIKINNFMETFEKNTEKLIRLLFRIMRIDTGDAFIGSLLQFIKFGIVGVSNTVVSYCIYVVTILCLKPWDLSWDFYVGNLTGFILSVLWSFYWNNRLVFKLKDGEKRNLFTALMKTYASYAFSGLLLSTVLSFVWVDIVGISKMVAPLLNLIATVPINFVLNKMWAFKSEGGTDGSVI